MLHSTDGRKLKKEVLESEFQACRSAISDADYQAMVDAIHAFCDRIVYFRTSWLPRRDPAIRAAFAPLIAACGGNQERSESFFGNILWRVIYDRTDDWFFNPIEEGMPFEEERDLFIILYWRKRKPD